MVVVCVCVCVGGGGVNFWDVFSEKRCSLKEKNVCCQGDSKDPEQLGHTHETSCHYSSEQQIKII